jgi:hypothetical protein
VWVKVLFCFKKLFIVTLGTEGKKQDMISQRQGERNKHTKKKEVSEVGEEKGEGGGRLVETTTGKVQKQRKKNST